jgi:hypothetical protein
MLSQRSLIWKKTKNLIKLLLYVSTVSCLIKPSFRDICSPIINCLSIFPSVSVPNSCFGFSYILVINATLGGVELQSKCWSLDEMKKHEFFPNPSGRITIIVSKRKVYFKVLWNQSKQYFSWKNTLTQLWAHWSQFANSSWLSQCICWQ